MTHPHFTTGRDCNCGFNKHRYKPDRLDPEVLGSWRPMAKTDAHHWEAKHYHASPHGLLRSVQTPFLTSEHPDPQAPANHAVSLTFRRPLHVFEPIHEGHIRIAEGNNNDGIVAHLPDNEQAVALDSGAVVPEHEHEWPY